MTNLEFSEDYKEALSKASTYLEPAIGITRQDAPSQKDKILIRQLNTLIALVTNLHTKINELEDRLQLVEDKLHGTPKDIQILIKSLKTTSLKKPKLKWEPPQVPNGIIRLF